GHRTVLTSRAIRAFFPCKADVIHTGLFCLSLMQQYLHFLGHQVSKTIAAMQRKLLNRTLVASQIVKT
ncbi:hypothetical protein OEZ49_21645, partial [Ruegeria sp. WL0004]